MVESPFLTEKEAAVFLRLAVGTLQNKRIAGTGPAFRRHGGRVLYERADLQAWSDAGRHTSTSEARRSAGSAGTAGAA